MQNSPQAAMPAPASNSSFILRPSSLVRSAWLFVPILYIMQAMPVTTAQEMFVVTFKDLKLANPLIVIWTSLLALPWTLKLFWAPLVDLNFTKRRWTLTMEVLIGLIFAVLAGCVLLPQYSGGQEQIGFAITVGLLLAMGIFSATHDIACDGLYILSLSRKDQAAFVGVQGSCYKLGRMLCVGGLVWLAGELEFKGQTVNRSWMVVLAICAVLYISGTIYNFFMLPAPAEDRPAMESEPGENRRDGLRTLLILILGVAIVLMFNSAIRIAGGGIFDAINRHRNPAAAILPQWQQSAGDMHYWGLMLAVGLAVSVITGLLMRPVLAGSAMAEAFVSFVRQESFWAIMAFIMFYRFGEAMVTRVLPLFLKDPLSAGGLGVSTRELGGIIGVAGVLGIICGGLVGGVVVAKLGLRKSFWPLAIAMYAPNVFYLLIALGKDSFADPAGWPNLLFHNWVLYLAAFVHEFGYGIGLATYSLFLMNIAQRGRFKTAHYAFGTGLGALCILAAGIVSGILLASVNYIWFFIAVCALSIPGMLTLLIVPMEG